MSVFEDSIAAATAVVGYDLFQNKPELQSSDVDRALRGIALAGSAAALDAKATLKVGSTTIGDVLNVATGAPTNDHIQPLNAFVPAGARISLVVTDAPATNPLNYRVILDDLE
jgi:hypothetical protein